MATEQAIEHPQHREFELWGNCGAKPRQSHEAGHAGMAFLMTCTSDVYIEEKVIKEELIKEDVRHF